MGKNAETNPIITPQKNQLLLLDPCMKVQVLQVLWKVLHKGYQELQCLMLVLEVAVIVTLAVLAPDIY
jgi:hypothetical protein